LEAAAMNDEEGRQTRLFNFIAAAFSFLRSSPFLVSHPPLV
jgi:hypothetical protein